MRGSMTSLQQQPRAMVIRYGTNGRIEDREICLYWPAKTREYRSLGPVDFELFLTPGWVNSLWVSRRWENRCLPAPGGRHLLKPEL